MVGRKVPVIQIKQKCEKSHRGKGKHQGKKLPEIKTVKNVLVFLFVLFWGFFWIHIRRLNILSKQAHLVGKLKSRKKQPLAFSVKIFQRFMILASKKKVASIFFF